MPAAKGWREPEHPCLRRFWSDFTIGVVALPLATVAAVWFSFSFLYIAGWGGQLWAPIGLLLFFGPLLWLPIYYLIVLSWTLFPLRQGRFGRVAALAVCLAGWAGYAEYQAIAARIDADRIVAANDQPQSKSGIDAVAFENTICDAICTELLAGGFVKTVYLERGNRQTRVLTMRTDGPCEGPDVLASKILRDNNRFDLCISESIAQSFTGGGLLFRDASIYDRDFYGLHRNIRAFTVSEWSGNQWRPLYEKKYGTIYVLQYLPVFIGGFTDSGWIGIDWWRRPIKVAEPFGMKDVINDALGIKLTGAFDRTVIKPFGNGGVMVTPNVLSPAPPAELAADIARMSTDADPTVRRQAAQSIGRFIKENKSYEPVRASLERLIADSGPEVKASAYQAIAYEPVDIDDRLLQSIMDNAPDWESSGLGGLLRRRAESQLKPYEAQIIQAYFNADRVTDRVHGNKGRETASAAIPALELDALKQIFDRCAEISDASLVTMGGNIDSDNRRMSNATLLKLKATWAPCTLPRMAAFNPFAIASVARALAWLGEGPAAAREIEKRLATPQPRDTPVDKSNLQGVLAWLNRFQGDFETRWSSPATPQQ